MPDALAQALALPGLGWLVAGAALAGIVRGFSGFGTAMVYLPIAGQILSPVGAITTMILMDVVGPLPNVPGAVKDAQVNDVRRLTVAALAALPVGLAVLLAVPPEFFRYAVSVLSLMLLAALLAGFRYEGKLTTGKVYATGGLGGFLGGACGVVGPPVILMYMASTLPARVIRANTLLFLLLMDFGIMALYALTGQLSGQAVLIGLLLIVPYTLANMLGAVLFDKGREGVYRAVAYVIIAGSALMGLPLLD